MNTSTRIVVTGLGLVTPLGCNLAAVWRRLLAGESGVVALEPELVADVPAKIAGVVPVRTMAVADGFDVDAVVPAKDQKKMERFIQFALGAAQDALTQARWFPADAEARARTATVIASGIGGFGAIADAVRVAETRGAKRLSPFTVPSFLANMAAGQVSIRFGLQGPLGAPVTACAAGLQAIGDAARLIRAGEADIALCGGAESCIDRVSLGSFATARALSTAFNDEPARASRPFYRARDGFVMGEGAARAMRQALRQAEIAPEDVQHVNAHATSTPLGDLAELRALRRVFGAHRPAISATKASTGHLLGAAGGLAAAFGVLALRDQCAPPTLNFEEADEEAGGADVVHGVARATRIEHVLCNGFGFGGVNASLLLRRYA